MCSEDVETAAITACDSMAMIKEGKSKYEMVRVLHRMEIVTTLAWSVLKAFPGPGSGQRAPWARAAFPSHAALSDLDRAAVPPPGAPPDTEDTPVSTSSEGTN